MGAFKSIILFDCPSQISDDEDDTHPNIDTASLFKWRHEARVERMAQKQTEEQMIKKGLDEVETKIKKAQQIGPDDNKESKEFELKKLEEEKKKLLERKRALEESLKSQPWNVDTISKESFSKTVLNKDLKPQPDRSKLTEEELDKLYQDFVSKHEKKLKEYAMLSKFDDCKSFLNANKELGKLVCNTKPDLIRCFRFLLVCDEASSYLTLWCLHLEIEGKTSLMEHISRPAISLHYILELAKQMKQDPRACISAFFTRIQTADQEYKDAYEDEVQAFRKRIKARAQVKIEEAMKNAEIEEREKRLGPGGLDPQEVFESLPVELQQCFESQNVELLQQTILKLDPDQVRYHMKRCVDSGLWVPDKSSPLYPGNEGKVGEEEKEESPAASTEPTSQSEETK